MIAAMYTSPAENKFEYWKSVLPLLYCKKSMFELKLISVKIYKVGLHFLMAL